MSVSALAPSRSPAAFPCPAGAWHSSPMQAPRCVVLRAALPPHAGWRLLPMHAPLRTALPCRTPACLQLRLWPACVNGLHTPVSPPNDDRPGSVRPFKCTSRNAEGHMQPTRTITLALAWLSCSAGASREATHDWEHAAAQQECLTQHAQVMQQRAEVDTIGHMAEMQHALHCQSPHIILLPAAQSVPWFSQQESRELSSPQSRERPVARLQVCLQVRLAKMSHRAAQMLALQPRRVCAHAPRAGLDTQV